jgi:hypothetical protein
MVAAMEPVPGESVTLPPSRPPKAPSSGSAATAAGLIPGGIVAGGAASGTSSSKKTSRPISASSPITPRTPVDENSAKRTKQATPSSG